MKLDILFLWQISITPKYKGFWTLLRDKRSKRNKSLFVWNEGRVLSEKQREGRIKKNYPSWQKGQVMWHSGKLQASEENCLKYRSHVCNIERIYQFWKKHLPEQTLS